MVKIRNSNERSPGSAPVPINVRKIVLDVLKPHQPNALEFSLALAAAGSEYRVNLTVIEVDEKTETLRIVIEAAAVDFAAVEAAIKRMGGSVHSIDEVEVTSGGSTGTGT